MSEILSGMKRDTHDKKNVDPSKNPKHQNLSELKVQTDKRPYTKINCISLQNSIQNSI